MDKKLFVIVCLSCLPFLFTLNGEFVFDDSEAVIKNKDITSEVWTDAFRHDFWGADVKSNLSHKSYRPLTILSFRINYIINNRSLSAFQFKVTNLICHVINCILLWKVYESMINKHSKHKQNDGENNKKMNLYKSNMNWWMDIPFLSTLIFAIHPVHVEAVSGIVGRADLMAAITFFLAFLCYCKANNNYQSSYIYLIGTIILAAISMLCKENGVTVLGFCLVYEITTKLTLKRKVSKNTKITSPMSHLGSDTVIRMIILALAATGLLYGRWVIMGNTKPEFKPTDNPTAFSTSLLTKISTYNYIYSLNGLLFILPEWLCYDWSMGCIQLIEKFTDIRMVIILLMYSYGVLILRSIVKGRSKKMNRVIILGVSLIIIPFLPATNIFYPVGFVIAERILYIPSAGYCLLIASGFNKLLQKGSLISYKMGVSMLLLLLFTYSARSWQRSGEWQNEYKLFVSALSVCPLNAKVHYNVAKVADANNQTTWAIAEYREAIRLFPAYYQAINNLANILKHQKQYDEAAYLLQTAVKYKRDFPAAWMNLGIVYAHTGRFNESEIAYRTAITYRKKYPDCYYNLGNLYLILNKTEDALSSWFQAINQNPKHVLAWTNLMALMDNTDQIDRALKIIPEALTELPDAPSINFVIANIYGKLNRYSEAETHFKKVIKLLNKEVQAIHYANLDQIDRALKIIPEALTELPDAPSINFVIANIYGKLNRYSEAETHFKKVIKLLNKEVQAIHYANLGVLYHRWKKYSLAIDMYTNALKIDPTFKTARNNLASLQRLNKH